MKCEHDHTPEKELIQEIIEKLMTFVEKKIPDEAEDCEMRRVIMVNDFLSHIVINGIYAYTCKEIGEAFPSNMLLFSSELSKNMVSANLDHAEREMKQCQMN